MNRPVPFNTARGGADATLPLKPPFALEGVTLRVFPLRANMFLLNSFVESYLNVAPPEIAYFRVASPYVYLLVIDYGKMAAGPANIGWISQDEVGFAVVLEKYRKEKNRLVFQDWAFNFPFIYVNNEFSLIAGREVYGWPKVLASFAPEINPWMINPRSSQILMSMKTKLIPKLYSGERSELRLLMEVKHEPPPTFSQFWPDLKNPFNPLLSVPRAAVNSLSLAGDYARLLCDLRPWFFDVVRNPQATLSRALRLGQNINLLNSEPYANIVTLKQFRDSRFPNQAAYQALIESVMILKSYNTGGFLGDLELLRGDPSGGFSIEIHRYAEQPIIESFGLEVARESAAGRDASVAVLKPVLPIWLNVDLHYGTGNPIAERTRTGPWRVNSSAPTTPEATKRKSIQGTSHAVFNTARGAALQQVSGPFSFPNTTLRVLPLMADKERLARFLEDYLQLPDTRFEPWGSYVYLIATNYEEMSSAANNLGFWADRELTFSFPVKRYYKNELVSVAMVSPFVFVNSSLAAITGREVDGRPTEKGTIESPPSTWMDESGPVAERRLLRLRLLVFPALGIGQPAERRELLDLHQGDALPYNDDVRWRMVAADWGQELLRDHRSKIERKRACPEEFEHLKALALELLVNREPLNGLTLKQFRDTPNPNDACYQAIVESRSVIEQIFTIEEIEDRIHLEIHSYPSQPIVETLGLKVKWQNETGSSVVQILQPIRPFWMKVGLSTELGRELHRRMDAARWEKAMASEKLFDERYFRDEDRVRKVGRELVARVEQDLGTRQHLRRVTEAWLGSTPPESRLTREQARVCVEALEPQLAVESILSNEWKHWGNPRLYQRISQLPDFCVRMDSVGTEGRELFSEGVNDGKWYSEQDGCQWYREQSAAAERRAAERRAARQREALRSFPARIAALIAKHELRPEQVASMSIGQLKQLEGVGDASARDLKTWAAGEGTD